MSSPLPSSTPLNGLHPVWIVTGPTAVGKTAFSIALAQRLGALILSADSQLVYRGLTIGTAKPTVEEQAGIPHHGLDLVDPTEPFSAANFKHYALPLLIAIRTTQPVVVTGGTGFYLRQLFEATTLPNIPPNPGLRNALYTEANDKGVPSLHGRLSQLDPARARQLHPNDRLRIVRALEIIDATGQPVPTQLTPATCEGTHWLGLQPCNQPWHWARIERRIHDMLALGWLDEVQRLVARYGPQAHALQVAHGYPELIQVLNGTRSLSDARNQIFINVRQYARRQRVWFARNPAITWHTVGPNTQFEAMADHVLAELAGPPGPKAHGGLEGGGRA